MESVCDGVRVESGVVMEGGGKEGVELWGWRRGVGRGNDVMDRETGRGECYIVT